MQIVDRVIIDVDFDSFHGDFVDLTRYMLQMGLILLVVDVDRMTKKVVIYILIDPLIYFEPLLTFLQYVTECPVWQSGQSTGTLLVTSKGQGQIIS